LTQTAPVGGSLGFDALAIVELVKTLAPADFDKGMTTRGDRTVRQDVYRPTTAADEV